MRHKPLPPAPGDLGTLHEARHAVPLVPGTEADCCARLQGRLDLPARDVAATWLAFLQALGLATEGPRGYTRVRGDPDVTELAPVFLSTVYGAREVHDVLAVVDGPVEAAAVAERTQELVTTWERRKHGPDWPSVWRKRTAHLLDWFVLLGLAEGTDGGYRATETG